jgi:hypothetical protein
LIGWADDVTDQEKDLQGSYSSGSSSSRSGSANYSDDEVVRVILPRKLGYNGLANIASNLPVMAISR